jgi:hypothetical protein
MRTSAACATGIMCRMRSCRIERPKQAASPACRPPRSRPSCATASAGTLQQAWPIDAIAAVRRQIWGDQIFFHVPATPKTRPCSAENLSFVGIAPHVRHGCAARSASDTGRSGAGAAAFSRTCYELAPSHRQSCVRSGNGGGETCASNKWFAVCSLTAAAQSPETNAQDTHHMSAKESAEAVDFVPMSA